MKLYIKRNKQAYNKLAELYRQRRIRISPFQTSPEKLSEMVLKAYQTKNNKTPRYFLELGPGNGSILKCFNDFGCITNAIELSEKMAKVAREISPNTVYAIDDINRYEFLDKQFDVIYAGAFIHLFPKGDAERVLKRVHKWLKNDGIFFLNTTKHNNVEEGYFSKEDYHISVERYRKKWKEIELIEFIKKNDFVIEEKFYHNEKDRNKEWINLILSKK